MAEMGVRAYLPLLLVACGRVAPEAPTPDAAADASADTNALSCPGVPSLSPKPVCDLRWSNGDGHQQIVGLAAAADGSVLVVGMADGTTTLGGFVLDGAPPWFSYDALIDSTCTVKWAHAFDGVATGVAAIGDDRFAIGSTVNDRTTLRVDAIDEKGDDLWTMNAISSFQLASTPLLAADGAGNLFVTGANQGAIDFGTGPLPVKTANPGAEQFLAKLDREGNVVYARSFGYAVTTEFVCDGSSLWLNGVIILDSVAFDGHVIVNESDATLGDSYFVRLSAQDGSFIDGLYDPVGHGLGANACSGAVYSGGDTLDAYGAPGAPKWTTKLDPPMWATAVDGEGNVWVGGSTRVSLASFGADASARYANHWGSDDDFNTVDALAITKTGAIVLSGAVYSPVIDFGLGPLSGTMDAASPTLEDAYLVRFE